MKKLLLGIIISIITLGLGVSFCIFGGLHFVKKMIMGGDSYYTQVTINGEKNEIKDVHDEIVTQYKYTLIGYDIKGNEKVLVFKGQQPRPLRKGAYVKITWNEKKGVTSYEEVRQKDIPKLAKEKLSKG
ncbi:YxeA family protein [Enterococcus ratti]|nr:YxeA family protein [Enterococcus ratti]